jgi:plastocyanin
VKKTRYGVVPALVMLGISALLVSACSGTTGSSTTPAPSAAPTTAPAPAYAGDVTVAEVNLAFSPMSVTLAVGDTVSFVNRDSTTHDVMIDGQDLGPQAPGATVTWKATKAGTFPYTCTIHSQMKGQAVVR